MAISSKTLFHFLRKQEYLLSTLTNGFWPRYCIEYCWGNKEIAIPMVCFCDIPLSQIRYHIKKYGGEGYGIGVSKKWAIEKGITPLLYFSYNSDFIYKKVYNYASRLSEKSICLSEDSISMEQRLLYFAKRVTESDFERILRNKDNNSSAEIHTKYYNEREWRYVPNITSEVHMEIIPRNQTSQIDGDRSNYLTKRCNELSENTRNAPLKLDGNNIQYIFIPREENRDSFIRRLKHQLTKNGRSSNLDDYISKIVSVENIEEDF